MRNGLVAFGALVFLALLAFVSSYRLDAVMEKRAQSLAPEPVEPAEVGMTVEVDVGLYDEEPSIIKQEIEYLLANPEALEKRKATLPRAAPVVIAQDSSGILPKTAGELAERLGNRPGYRPYEPPCPDGCDVGGASDKVPQGVLEPWYDSAYETTRPGLRINVTNAGAGRIERREECSEWVTLTFDPNANARTVANKDGHIRAHGVYRVQSADVPLSDLHQASRVRWFRCQ